MIFNMVGGGTGGAGGGATLVVSSPSNVSVTVSKDDKSYTKNSGSLGSAIFKGLATGTWTVTISGNEQTATRTIEITADYAITIAFFSASINITYPATSTCVVTDSSGQTVASDSNTGTSTKTWTAIVNATGTYTVTAAATDSSGDSISETVGITTEGQSVSVELSYRLWLYKNGDECTDVTGGWIVNQGTKTAEYLEITYKQSTVGSKNCMETANSIDLTGYNTLAVHVETNNFSSFFGIGAGSGVVGSTPTPTAEIVLNKNYTGWCYLNVAAVNTGKILLRGAETGKATVDQIYATKEVLS